MNNHILQPTDIAGLKVNYDVLKLFPKDEAVLNQVLARDKGGKQGEKLSLLTTNNDSEKLNQIIISLQSKNYIVEVYYTDDIGFRMALARYDQMLDYQKQLELKKDYRLEVRGEKAVELLKETIANKSQFSEVDLITEIVRLSFQSGASDMHLQGESQGVILRLRRNGVLEQVAMLTHEDFAVYLMKIKYISGVKMNIAKTPQDGRFEFQVRMDDTSRQIDARVSFMPGLRGESVVVRFLDSSKSIMTFSEIGFEPYHIPLITANLEKNSGLILVTGPTGSGKTTTLYSMLAYLNTPDVKIVTLEDPVEYEIAGLQQSGIHEESGYTFAEGIKAVLRHDPDIILVGEIRDLDTANAAINAALTGHLVFSTLHTNSALDSISRLLNLGVKPYLLAPALNMIIGQRLVRKVEENSETLGKVNENVGNLGNMEENSEKMDLENNLKYIREHFPDILQGVPVLLHDENVEFTGRLAVAEIFEPTEQERMMILQGKLGLEMFDDIKKRGYITLQEDAYIKTYNGLTTMEEVRRVV